MKKKSDLWMLAIALVSILFIVVLFIAASASKSDMQNSNENIILLEEETITQERETTEGDEAGIPETIYKDGSFFFTVDEFAKYFSGTLPAGYIFSNELDVNAQRDNKMQLDILEENGTATDISIIFDDRGSDQTCKQIVLVIKSDCYEADAAAALRWYTSTFLEVFEEMRTAVCEDYLKMFLDKTENYKVYSEDGLMTMMSCETEEDGKYYYVLVSVQ